jgi:nucleotide-binding universal stress UspA family protein
MAFIRTILHPSDFSETSRPAFQTACALARGYDANLILLQLQSPIAAPVVREPSDPQLPVWHLTAQGDVSEEILRLSRAFRFDLIVIGTPGLPRNLAEEIMRRAACPVLVVTVSQPEPSLTDTELEPGADSLQVTGSNGSSHSGQPGF